MSTKDALQQAQLSSAFAAPILEHQWNDTHDLNAELRQYALDLMRGGAGNIISNVGGWSSKKDILDADQPMLQTLSEMAQMMMVELMHRCLVKSDAKLLENWHMEAWFNVNNPGGFNELHNHGRPPSVWSGIYYVDLGTDDPALSGRTVFENCHKLPHPAQQRFNFTAPHVMVPNPGLMLLFPASFFHRVEKHLGDRPRITVAFNFSHDEMSLSTGPLEEFLRQRETTAPSSPTRQWMWQNFAGVMKVHRKISSLFRPRRKP